MDFLLDAIASLFGSSGRPKDPAMRALGWAIAIGTVLVCGFIYLVFAGF